MSGTKPTLDGLLDALTAVNTHDLQHEIRVLRGIKEWALAQVGLAVGDRVALPRLSIGPDNGWYCYRECLAEGSPAVVHSVTFSVSGSRWLVGVIPERIWSVHPPLSSTDEGQPRRYWSGPAADTPEGMTPPSKYDQQHYPDGKPSIFTYRPERLTKLPAEVPV